MARRGSTCRYPRRAAWTTTRKCGPLKLCCRHYCSRRVWRSGSRRGEPCEREHFELEFGALPHRSYRGFGMLFVVWLFSTRLPDRVCRAFGLSWPATLRCSASLPTRRHTTSVAAASLAVCCNSLHFDLGYMAQKYCLTEQDCRAKATASGLQLGGGGYAFAKATYNIKGCYAYASGPLEGRAFFGKGGTEAQMSTPTVPRIDRVRLTCSPSPPPSPSPSSPSPSPPLQTQSYSLAAADSLCADAGLFKVLLFNFRDIFR